MKIADVIARVREVTFCGEHGSVSVGDRVGDPLLELIVLEAVRCTGLEVAPDGEVYNPAPAPAASVPEDNWRRAARPRRRR